MRLGLIVKKIGMSRLYDSSGINQCVTILKVDNCKIIEIKTKEKNNYNALRLSYGVAKKPSKKPLRGFLKKNNLKQFILSKEFRVENEHNYKIGDEVSAENFTEGQFVDISGNTIGKGFAGGMKRHNFSGNRATHGVSISHRSHGSTGQCQDPGKVFKGKKMAGRLGNVKRTMQNLLVLKVYKENNTILVRGSVPGPSGSYLKIFDSVKKSQMIEKPKPVQEQSQLQPAEKPNPAQEVKPEVAEVNPLQKPQAQTQTSKELEDKSEPKEFAKKNLKDSNKVE